MDEVDEIDEVGRVGDSKSVSASGTESDSGLCGLG